MHIEPDTPTDPRDLSVQHSPKPLRPPGTTSDGFGNYRPLLARSMLLEPAQAAALLFAGVPQGFAHVFPYALCAPIPPGVFEHHGAEA